MSKLKLGEKVGSNKKRIRKGNSKDRRDKRDLLKSIQEPMDREILSKKLQVPLLHKHQCTISSSDS